MAGKTRKTTTKLKIVSEFSKTRKQRNPQKKGRNPKWFVGTSGFMISQKNWLSIPNLNCIEINSTFYKLPSEKSIKKWSEFPEHVSFSLKASKYITHMKRLKDVKAAWKVFWDRIKPLQPKLKTVLIQLPPSFQANDVNIERVKKMKDYLPTSVNIVFEFRNMSWFNDNIYDVFRKNNWCVGGTYIKKKEGSSWMGTMPPGLLLPPKTSDLTYLRIHGGRGYRGELSESELSKLKKEIASRKAKENFVMFNNTFFNSRKKSCKYKDIKIIYAAVCNAIEFTKL